jgi:hypothetical protein
MGRTRGAGNKKKEKEEIITIKRNKSKKKENIYAEKCYRPCMPNAETLRPAR